MEEGGPGPAEGPGRAGPGAASHTVCRSSVRCDLPAQGAGRPVLRARAHCATAPVYGACTADSQGAIRGVVHAPFAAYAAEVRSPSLPPRTELTARQPRSAVSAPTGSVSGVARGHQSSAPGSDS
ncbi:hypothetical protein GCM10010392_48040 [Streptomyces clavifer]|nr:hypothetical protein GCM10010392_48040 [Streptomyces clavifer]